VLILYYCSIDEIPGLRIESFAIISITNQNKLIILHLLQTPGHVLKFHISTYKLFLTSDYVDERASFSCLH
jgi:hypothetical protein